MAVQQRTTSVTLGGELHTFIERSIESGRYHTASEVVRDGLRVLIEREERWKAFERYAESLPVEEPTEEEREWIARIETDVEGREIDS